MTGKRILELYAWVVLDDMDGNEGVPATLPGPDGIMLPLMGADRERIESLRRFAEIAASVTGKPVELRRWAGPYELIETVEPAS